MVLLVENPAHQCLFAGNDLYRLLITDGFHDFFTTLLHLTQRDIISFNRYTIVYVECDGPPPVITIGWTNILNAPIVIVINTKIQRGFNSGNVMSLNFCHPLA